MKKIMVLYVILCSDLCTGMMVYAKTPEVDIDGELRVRSLYDGDTDVREQLSVQIKGDSNFLSKECYRDRKYCAG